MGREHLSDVQKSEHQINVLLASCFPSSVKSNLYSTVYHRFRSSMFTSEFISKNSWLNDCYICNSTTEGFFMWGHHFHQLLEIFHFTPHITNVNSSPRLQRQRIELQMVEGYSKWSVLWGPVLLGYYFTHLSKWWKLESITFLIDPHDITVFFLCFLSLIGVIFLCVCNFAVNWCSQVKNLMFHFKVFTRLQSYPEGFCLKCWLLPIWSVQ